MSGLNTYAYFCAVFLDFISAAIFAIPAADSIPASSAAIMIRTAVGARLRLAGVGVIRCLRGMYNPGLGVKNWFVRAARPRAPMTGGSG